MSFYVLHDHPVHRTSSETEFMYVGRENQRTAPHCDTCGDVIGLLARVPPYTVELEVWERAFGDVAFGVGYGLLISERMRAVCKDHAIVGFKGFEPVQVLRVKKHKRFKGDPPRYFHVTVVRGRAAIDQEKSGFVWETPPTCPECRLGNDLKRWQRIILEPGTWSGEDIFMPRGLSGTYMVTQRFKDICEQYRIQNAYFIPAEEYEHDFYPWDNIERARELATMPLGHDLLEKTLPNGERWRYYPRRNELLVIHADGQLELCRPAEGVEFWNRH